MSLDLEMALRQLDRAEQRAFNWGIYEETEPNAKPPEQPYSGSWWEGIGPKDGEIVSEEDALDYVAAECGFTVDDPDAPEHQEFVKSTIDWYFSGNWIKHGGNQE